MLELFGINKEKMTNDTIKSTLEDVGQELNCSLAVLFIMIKPTDEQGNFKCYIYKDNKVVREITLKEILGD